MKTTEKIKLLADIGHLLGGTVCTSGGVEVMIDDTVSITFNVKERDDEDM